MTEGMSKYAVLDSLWDLVPVDAQPEAGVVLCGLPSYAYDMHTRVGRRALVFCSGQPTVKQFFATHPQIKKLDALGWALFYVEGGKIKNELLDEDLLEVERELAFASVGVFERAAWMDLLGVMDELVGNGVLRELRVKSVKEAYGQCVVAEQP